MKIRVIRVPITPVLLVLGLAQIAIFETRRTRENPQTNFPELKIELPPGHFSKKYLAHGVVQYSSDSLLIYVKPIRGFFSSEHTPLICWEGSGYRFSESGEQILADGRRIYTGILKNDAGETLQTSWWYTNGTTETVSQLRWRWLDLTGAEPFFLVNFTRNNANFRVGEK